MGTVQLLVEVVAESTGEEARWVPKVDRASRAPSTLRGPQFRKQPLLGCVPMAFRLGFEAGPKAIRLGILRFRRERRLVAPPELGVRVLDAVEAKRRVDRDRALGFPRRPRSPPRLVEVPQALAHVAPRGLHRPTKDSSRAPSRLTPSGRHTWPPVFRSWYHVRPQ